MHCAASFENNGFLKEVLIFALGGMFEMSGELYFLVLTFYLFFERYVIFRSSRKATFFFLKR